MNTERHDEELAEPQEATVPWEAAGRRFDQVLAELFPDFSRSRLTEWIKSGDALLEGRQVKPKESVRGGETVSLAARMSTETHAEPEDIPLDILYQDSEVLVIDKAAGLVVHPGAGNPRGTLVNALLHFDAKLAELPRAGLVHRLDKDTRGVLVSRRTPRSSSSSPDARCTASTSRWRRGR
jgi:23S rRNA pseudouridine1911/1915/1917 synthase